MDASWNYGLFPRIMGSHCFLFGKISDILFFSWEIPESLKICGKKIISSYCCRRSVPVGVPTLYTIQKLF